VQRHLLQEAGTEDWAEYFGCDFWLFSLPQRCGTDDPAVLYGPLPPGTTFDEWGIGHWAGGMEGTQERISPPLASARSVKQIEAFPLPVVVADRDESAIGAFHAAGYPVFGYAGSIYEWSWWLRGMEQVMTDPVAEDAAF